jgi:hypothetical protein
LCTFQDICYDLYCTNGAKIVRSHPAIEGTVCGKDKVCSLGKCCPLDKLYEASPSQQTPIQNDPPPSPAVASWNSLVSKSLWAKITEMMAKKKRRETTNIPTSRPGSVKLGRSAGAGEDATDLAESREDPAYVALPSSPLSTFVLPMTAVEWKVTREPCSASCGGGKRRVSVDCVITGTGDDGGEGRRVDPELCLGVAPAPDDGSVEDCNTHACPSGQWEARAWGKCVAPAAEREQQVSLHSYICV